MRSAQQRACGESAVHSDLRAIGPIAPAAQTAQNLPASSLFAR
jgi:hypothetical protein